MKTRACRAFSLIEILVVISIIVLLIALLLPTFAAARESARTAVCASQLNQIYIGFRYYAVSEKNYIAPRYMLPPINGTGVAYYWPRALVQHNYIPMYAPGRETALIFWCPSEPLKTAVFADLGNNMNGLVIDTDKDGVDEIYTFGGATYGMVSTLSSWTGAQGYKTIRKFNYWIGQENKLLMLGDARDTVLRKGIEAHPRSPVFRHNNALNTLYLDGHITRPSDTHYYQLPLTRWATN